MSIEETLSLGIYSKRTISNNNTDPTPVFDEISRINTKYPHNTIQILYDSITISCSRIESSNVSSSPDGYRTLTSNSYCSIGNKVSISSIYFWDSPFYYDLYFYISMMDEKNIILYAYVNAYTKGSTKDYQYVQFTDVTMSVTFIALP